MYLEQGQQSEASFPSTYLHSTKPTTGVDRKTLSSASGDLKFVEVGGAMKTIWNSQLSSCAVLVFVLDLSNRVQVFPAAFELFQLMSHPQLKQVPIVLVLSKCDTESRLTRSELQMLMRLDDLIASRSISSAGKQTQKQNENENIATAPFHIVEVSTLTGENVRELLELLEKLVSSQPVEASCLDIPSKSTVTSSS